MSEDRQRFDAQKLTDFSAKILEKLGVPAEDAMITAKMLVRSDLRGVESHGVAHLKMFYARRIKLGIINLHPKFQIISKAPSTALMDGDNGLGFVVGHHAMKEAIRRAEETGAGFVTVKNSTHIGAAAYYAMMALEHDMIGISMANMIPGVVAPGSSIPALGTNPFSVAVPSGKKSPVVLDMATSAVAAGKIEVASRTGSSIPEGWLVDSEGKPVTDPTKRVWGQGGLLPLGGIPALGAYKGFGLGLLVEIMTGILSGMGPEILQERKREEMGNASNNFYGALRISSFIPVETFKKSMDDMIEAMEALPTIPGVEKVSIPGGYEETIVKDRKTNGVPLDEKVIRALNDLAEELDVEFDL